MDKEFWLENEIIGAPELQLFWTTGGCTYCGAID